MYVCMSVRVSICMYVRKREREREILEKWFAAYTYTQAARPSDSLRTLVKLMLETYVRTYIHTYIHTYSPTRHTYKQTYVHKHR
jgi:hypothetical protein